MNMLYEGLKDNATIVIVPSTAVEQGDVPEHKAIAAILRY
jgi:hypothetical protein